MEEWYSINGRHFVMLPNDYVLLNDTTTHPVCEICGEGIEETHYTCVLRDIIFSWEGVLLLILFIIIILLFPREKVNKN
jgi:hypothetical protein